MEPVANRQLGFRRRGGWGAMDENPPKFVLVTKGPPEQQTYPFASVYDIKKVTNSNTIQHHPILSDVTKCKQHRSYMWVHLEISMFVF